MGTTPLGGLPILMDMQRTTMVNENEVRIAAGLTMAIGAYAFCQAYFEQQYGPLRIVTTYLFLDFTVRVLVGLRFTPVGQLARLLARGRTPEWVSTRPKNFAWTMGIGMGFAMMVITNGGVHGWIPRIGCLICLTLMWLESAAGLCLGC